MITSTNAVIDSSMNSITAVATAAPADQQNLVFTAPPNKFRVNPPSEIRNSLKVISFNIAKSVANIDSIKDEIWRRENNILLTLNEVPFHVDLSQFGLSGHRHPENTRLMILISDHLRSYTTCFKTKFSFYGIIQLPPSAANAERSKIGFVSCYRNPKLDLDFEGLNKEFFQDLSNIMEELTQKCELVYVSGDMNCFDHRYQRFDTRDIVTLPSYNVKRKSYKLMLDCFPTFFESCFTGVTHFPRDVKVLTVSQLDYVFAIGRSGKIPTGVAKTIRSKSDHLALVVNLKLPQYTFPEVTFEPAVRLIDSQYDLVESTMLKLVDTYFADVVSDYDLDTAIVSWLVFNF